MTLKKNYVQTSRQLRQASRLFVMLSQPFQLLVIFHAICARDYTASMP